MRSSSVATLPTFWDIQTPSDGVRRGGTAFRLPSSTFVSLA